MTSRPHDLDHQVPGGVAATFMLRRLRTAADRNRAAWRRVWRNKRRAQTRATPDHSSVAVRVSAPLENQWQRDARERLSSVWRGADFSEALEPLGLPTTRRSQDSSSHSWARGITTQETVSYAARLITFSLAVGIIHFAVLWWIFLRIGS